MAEAKAPATPFDKLAAAFGATARSEARDGGPVETFPIFRAEALTDVSLSRGVAPCLVVRSREEEAAPSSGFRKNIVLRTRARLVYPTLCIRRVTPLERVNAMFALRSEPRTGDQRFDREVTIESIYSDEVLTQAFASPQAREAVLRVLDAGFILFFEERAIRADLAAPSDSHIAMATVGPVVDALGTLVATVPRLDPASFTARPQVGRFITGAIVVIGLLAAAALAPGTINDAGVRIRPLPHPIVPIPMMVPGVLAGAGAFILAYLVLRWQLKRRNVATDLPIVLALFVVLATLGVGALDAANRLLDEAPLAVHDVKVLSKDTGKSRKSGNVTEWFLAVPSWQAGSSQLELSVDPELYRALRTGDLIRVTAHPGYLGWQWGAVVERVPGAAPATAPPSDAAASGSPRDERPPLGDDRP